MATVIMIDKEDIEKRREKRKKITHEFFTSPDHIKDFLSFFSDIKETDNFLDNFAGNGNILLESLKHRLSLGHDPMIALNCIYGVEKEEDNVEEARERIFIYIKDFIEENLYNKAKEIIRHHIVCHDAFTWDYDNWRPPPKSKKI